MSAPHLTDSSISNEWMRADVVASTTEKPRPPSQASIADGVASTRRKRFARLVTYTMLGLVAFTVLGVALFLWRRHAMQNALASPPPASLVAATPSAVTTSPAPTPAFSTSETTSAAAGVASSAPAAKPTVAKKGLKRSPISSTTSRAKVPKH